MAKLVSTLGYHPLESGGSSRQLGGRILSLKWGAVALLVLLAIIIAIAVNTLQHQVAAKQDAAPSVPLSQKPEATPAPAPSHTSSDTDVQSSQSVRTQITNNGSHTTSDVTVNGKQIPVPTNGTVHKEFTDDDGNKAEVNISTNSSQSESSSDSSISVNVSSEQSIIDNSE
jgi:hypothetical protein